MVAKLIARYLSPLWILQWYSVVRFLCNILITILLSATIFGVFRFFGFWSFAVGIGCAFACFCFWYLETEPIYLWCPECKKFINTSKPWRCGYEKRCGNRNVAEYPFIGKCQYCHKVPTGYRCPEGHFIFFTADEDNIHVATSLDTAELPLPIIVVTDKEKTLATREEELAALNHQLNVTKVRSDIILEANRASKQSGNAIYEEMKNKVITRFKQKMATRDIEAEVIAQINRDYPDEKERQECIAALKDAIRDTCL